MTTAQIDELVERLRAYAVPWKAHGWTNEATAITEAADLLTSLNEERERLRAALDSTQEEA